MSVDPRVNRVVLGQHDAELVAAEHRSLQVWNNTTDARRAGVLCLVRETLLRLLADPHWVPMSLGTQHEGRVDVTFTIELSEVEAAAARAAEDADTLAELKALARALQKTD